MEGLAIVLDADLKSSLATIRSLGKDGITVVTGATRKSAMGLHSNQVQETFVYPDPKSDKMAFLMTIKNEADKLKRKMKMTPVLYCFSDSTHVSVFESIGTFGDLILFPKPRPESFAIAFDKTKTAVLAERNGISTIRTHDISDTASLNYPVVIKPNKSVSWKGRSGVSDTAQFIFSSEKLESVYKELESSFGSSPIIQTSIVGEEYGVELMCDNGRVLTHFMHRRIRSLSPTGGAAVVKQTAPIFSVTEDMRDQSIKLAEALQWTGPMMVEWKLEKKLDKLYLMEINGRFWGSLPLAVKAGINFPKIYYRLAQGENISDVGNVTPLDVRTRHFWGDVKWLFKVLFDVTPLRTIYYPKRTKALYFFFLEFFRSKGDVYAQDDSWPSVMEIVDIFKR